MLLGRCQRCAGTTRAALHLLAPWLEKLPGPDHHVFEPPRCLVCQWSLSSHAERSLLVCGGLQRCRWAAVPFEWKGHRIGIETRAILVDGEKVDEQGWTIKTHDEIWGVTDVCDRPFYDSQSAAVNSVAATIADAALCEACANQPGYGDITATWTGLGPLGPPHDTCLCGDERLEHVVYWRGGENLGVSCSGACLLSGRRCTGWNMRIGGEPTLPIGAGGP